MKIEWWITREEYDDVIQLHNKNVSKGLLTKTKTSSWKVGIIK